MDRDPQTARWSRGRVRAGKYPEIPALRRGAWIFVGWTLMGVLAMFAYLGLALFVFNRPIWASGAALPVSICQAYGAYRWISWNRRIKQQVARGDADLCLHCLYPLAGLGPRGHCPECGKDFELTHLRAVWSKFQV